MKYWKKGGIEGFGPDAKRSPRLSLGAERPKSLALGALGPSDGFSNALVRSAWLRQPCGEQALLQKSRLKIIYRRVKVFNSCL